MTLYVVTQPDPPPGEDFRFTVPGRYLYDVTGITATLNTGAVGVAVDSSGNGHNGTYQGFPTFVAGLVAGDTAVQLGQSPPPVGFANVDIPPVMPDLTQGWSFAFWAESFAPGERWAGAIRYLTDPPFTDGFLEIYSISVGGNDGVIHVGAYTTTWQTDTIPGIFDGNPHFVTIESDGATQVTVQVDTISILTSEVGGPNPFTNFTPVSASIGSTGGGAAACYGILDEFAIYDQELGSLQQDALYAAASVSFAAYTAAVLADNPVAYYHLDQDTSTGRQPSLIVNDGTTELEAIPTGFPAVATPGPYEYSWQPDLNADTQSTDGTLTTVAIPRLILPAGYTVGVRTLDLQPGDQWSNVTLWWDDAYRSATDPANRYRFPGPIKLVYERAGATP